MKEAIPCHDLIELVDDKALNRLDVCIASRPRPKYDNPHDSHIRTDDKAMDLSFLTPEIFNILILLNIAVGLVLAAWRFYTDLTRSPSAYWDDVSHLEDTRPHEQQAMQPDDAS